MEPLHRLEAALELLYRGAPAEVASADEYLRRLRSDATAVFSLVAAVEHTVSLSPRAWMFVVTALAERVAEQYAKDRLGSDVRRELQRLTAHIMCQPDFVASPVAVHAHLCSAIATLVVAAGLEDPANALDQWNTALDLAAGPRLRLELFVSLAEAVSQISPHILARSAFRDPVFGAVQANCVHQEASGVLSSSKSLHERRSAARAITKWASHSRPGLSLQLLASSIGDADVSETVGEAISESLIKHPALGASHLIHLCRALSEVVQEALKTPHFSRAETVVHSVSEVAADISDYQVDHLLSIDRPESGREEALNRLLELLVACVNSPFAAAFEAACAGMSALVFSASAYGVRDAPLIDSLPTVVRLIVQKLATSIVENRDSGSDDGTDDCGIDRTSSRRRVGGDCLLAICTLLGPPAYSIALGPPLNSAVSQKDAMQIEAVLFAVWTAADAGDASDQSFIPFIQAALSDVVQESSSPLVRQGAMQIVASFAPLLVSLGGQAYAEALTAITASMRVVPKSSARALKDLVEVSPAQLVPHLEPLLIIFENLLDNLNIRLVVVKGIATALAMSIATLNDQTQRSNATSIILRRPALCVMEKKYPTIRALEVISTVMFEVADLRINIPLLLELQPKISDIMADLDGGCSSNNPHTLAEAASSLFVSALTAPSKEYRARELADPEQLSTSLSYTVQIIVKNFCSGPLHDQPCLLQSLALIIPVVELTSIETKQVMALCIFELFLRIDTHLRSEEDVSRSYDKVIQSQETASVFFQLLVRALETEDDMISLIFTSNQDFLPKLCKLATTCLVGSNAARSAMNWWKRQLAVSTRVPFLKQAMEAATATSISGIVQALSVGIGGKISSRFCGLVGETLLHLARFFSRPPWSEADLLNHWLTEAFREPGVPTNWMTPQEELLILDALKAARSRGERLFKAAIGTTMRICSYEERLDNVGEHRLAMDLNDVLQSSMSLRVKSLSQQKESTRAGENLSVERSLNQIDKETARLVPSKLESGPRRHADQTARRLLAAQGVEEERLFRNLHGITLIDTVPLSDDGKTTAPSAKRRISTCAEMEEFLADIHEHTVEAAVEDCRQNAFNKFRDAVNSAVRQDTRRATEELCRQISKGLTSGRTPSTNADHTNRGLSGNKRQAQLRCGYSDSDFGEVIKGYVASGSSISIAEDLYKVAQRRRFRMGRRDEDHVLSCYAALRYVTCEDVESEVTMTGIMDGARQSLEALFIERILSPFGLPPGADAFSIEGLIFQVQSLVQSQVQSKRIPAELTYASAESLSGLPLWPQIYFTLRAGSIAAASNILYDAQEEVWSGNTAQATEGLAFVRHFNSWASNDYFLGDAELREIVEQYKINVQGSNDPYRRACYILIMRLNPENELALPESDDRVLYESVEEYCWLRLHCVRLHGPHPAAPSELRDYALTLSRFQSQLCHFGNKYFDPTGREPAKYAFVLLISGQFSQAIQCLAEAGDTVDPVYREDAVHLGVGLAAHGMLKSNIHAAVSSAVSSIDRGKCDFESLLWDYVSDFGGRFVADAALYLFLVPDASVRLWFIQRLAESSGEHEVLFGSMTEGGGSGVVQQLSALAGHAEDCVIWTNLLVSEARRSALAGDEETALHLYEMTGGHEGEMMTILNRRLSRAVDRRGSPTRGVAIMEANVFLEAIKGVDLQGKQSEVEKRTLESLLGLAFVYDHWWEGRSHAAFEELRNLELLPLRPDGMEDPVLLSYNVLSGYQPAGPRYSAELLARVPEIISLTVDILSRVYSDIMQRMSRFLSPAASTTDHLRPADRLSGPLGSHGIRSPAGWSHGEANGLLMNVERVEQICKAVINLAGMLRLEGRELNAKLLELDALLP